MTDGMMGWGMGEMGIALVLGIATLVKYLR